ncbi:MAG: DinB family protein [Candidatus Hodarchaeota archaeon]
MNNISKIFTDAINEQFGAAIRMLEQNLKKCPEELWDDKTKGPSFWHVAYHAMWFLDWYLSDSKKSRENFKSKFGEENTHFESLDKTPEIILTREQLFEYLSDIKEKARNRFEDLTSEDLIEPSVFEWHGNSVLSSLLYNLRHLMLHIGALNLRLHRKDVKLKNWVSYQRI